jgi:hypothetical protein
MSATPMLGADEVEPARICFLAGFASRNLSFGVAADIRVAWAGSQACHRGFGIE